MIHDSHRPRNLACLLALLLCVGTFAAFPADAQQASPISVAIIDVTRILEESQSGKELIAELKKIQETKYGEAQVQQDEMKDIQARITEGRLSLSEERLAELRKELDRKAIALKRFEDDSNRELNEFRQGRLEKIEARLMPIINQVGEEFGYTLIFNKFQSGLVFAQQEIDITDLILQRFDAATGQDG
jgi:outer membrane protein